MTAPALLTEAEAAEILHVSPRTLRSLRCKGAIHYVRTSPRTILYAPEDLAEYVAKVRCQDNAPELPRKSKKVAAGSIRGNVVRFTQRQR